MDVPGLGQENYEVSLEHLDVSESKEVFNEWGHVKIIQNRPKQSGQLIYRDSAKVIQWEKDSLCNKWW